MQTRSTLGPFLVSLLVSTIPLATQAIAQSATTLLAADDLKWTTNSALPKGFQAVTLTGDPAKPGDMVVQRVKLPAHALVPPHTHPFAETITVLSGTVGFGLGDKVDKGGQMSSAGGFFAHAARDPHYVWTGDEAAIVQIQFIAPGGIDYINPDDDPRRK